MKIHDEFFIKNRPEFKIGVAKERDIPLNNLTEVSFIGRSNVGKSSLINTITNSNIAVVSKTPGRTKQLNFFQISDKLTIVDMPGYGYAKASKDEIENWNKLIFKYFSSRANLKRVFLLVDSRHGLKQNDEEIMKVLDKSGILYQIILTKVDEIKEEDLKNKLKNIQLVFNKYTALFSEVLFSSSKRSDGISEIRETIYNLI